ncbi:MAG: orotidine-5'-phosphate decarboxylase [Actinomycetota bacterium]
MRRVGANPLVVALDTSDLDRAEGLATALAGAAGVLKVGLELFTAAGPAAVERVRPHGPVFLDLKLHDIPTTVGRAARNAGRLGAALLTVHSLGGPSMVEAAVEGSAAGANEAGFGAPAILAVTVLSSVGGESLASPASLAFEAVQAGASGVVVSGDDVKEVREVLGEEPIVVVPGVRPSGSGSNDHVRVLSPREAMASGADHIVVGRPVADASDPAGAARAILSELS